jgi:hypothetical protein
MDYPHFDYEKLLTHLEHLGGKVVDAIYGNRVDIPVDYGRAITISPGDEDEPLYVVAISNWDQTGAGNDKPVGETDDIMRAIEHVRDAYMDEGERLEREDAAWASLLGKS